MKAHLTIEYDPQDPADVEFINNIQKASTLKCIMLEYDQWLRSLIKYSNLTEESEKIYQECRNKLNELLNEEGVDIYNT